MPQPCFGQLEPVIPAAETDKCKKRGQLLDPPAVLDLLGAELLRSAAAERARIFGAFLLMARMAEDLRVLDLQTPVGAHVDRHDVIDEIRCC